MPTDPRRVFPRRLRYYIREDQRGFCKEHGFDETRLSKMLRADSLNPQLETIYKLASALGIEVSDLLADEVEDPAVYPKMGTPAAMVAERTDMASRPSPGDRYRIVRVDRSRIDHGRLDPQALADVLNRESTKGWLFDRLAEAGDDVFVILIRRDWNGANHERRSPDG
jgi:transcriptional regulator with XRE-family HTH domain